MALVSSVDVFNHGSTGCKHGPDDRASPFWIFLRIQFVQGDESAFTPAAAVETAAVATVESHMRVGMRSVYPRSSNRLARENRPSTPRAKSTCSVEVFRRTSSAHVRLLNLAFDTQDIHLEVSVRTTMAA